MGRMALMLSLLAAIALNVLAEPTEVAGRDALARALGGARLPLENGLVIGASGGTPISGKYEIDNGTFQLSVYTVKTDGASGETFMEVIVDTTPGAYSGRRRLRTVEISPLPGARRTRSLRPRARSRPPRRPP